MRWFNHQRCGASLTSPHCCSFISIRPQSDTNSQWLKPQTTGYYKHTDPSADLSKTNHVCSVWMSRRVWNISSVMIMDKITSNINPKDVYSIASKKWFFFALDLRIWCAVTFTTQAPPRAKYSNFGLFHGRVKVYFFPQKHTEMIKQSS